MLQEEEFAQFEKYWRDWDFRNEGTSLENGFKKRHWKIQLTFAKWGHLSDYFLHKTCCFLEYQLSHCESLSKSAVRKTEEELFCLIILG